MKNSRDWNHWLFMRSSRNFVVIVIFTHDRLGSYFLKHALFIDKNYTFHVIHVLFQSMPFDNFKRNAPDQNEHPMVHASYWKYILDHHIHGIIGCSLDLYKTESKSALRKISKCIDRLSKLSRVKRGLVAGGFAATVGSTVATAGLLAAPYTAGISLGVTAAVGSVAVAGLAVSSSSVAIDFLAKKGWKKSDTQQAREATMSTMDANKKLEEFLTICIQVFTTAMHYVQTEEGTMFLAFLREKLSICHAIYFNKQQEPVDDLQVTSHTLALVEYIIRGQFSRDSVCTALHDVSTHLPIEDTSASKVWDKLLERFTKFDVKATRDAMLKVFMNVKSTTDKLLYVYDNITTTPSNL